MTNDSSLTPSVNKHVRDYLDYYFSLRQPPGFAVLVNGAWGSGKTFLVKRVLEEHFSDPSSYAYVSLYGLSNVDEIDSAVLRAMYPALNWRGTKLAGRAAKTALKFFRIDPELKLPEFLGKNTERLYVFDDLERVEMPINRVLGYINELVEHDGCKVLLIANEAEIEGQADYLRRREKLVGKTLEVHPEFEEAYRYFVNLLEHPDAVEFLNQHASEVRAIYLQSNASNLRILLHTMWDFERLLHAIPKQYRQNERGMVVLVRLIFALSLELKAGRIAAADLKSRMSRIVQDALAKAEPIGLAAANKKYPEIELADGILSDDVLVDILVRGWIDQPSIEKCLQQSAYFDSAGPEPAWRTVWHFRSRSDEQVSSAIEEMERLFLARDYVQYGEIMHVFGLRLWLADARLITKGRGQVLAECFSYLDDLYASKKMKPQAAEPFDRLMFGGYGGLQIYEHGSDDLRRLHVRVHELAKQVAQDEYPSIAASLLEDLSGDAEKFFRQLVPTNSPENIYAYVPVLSAMDHDRFVDVLLGLYPEDQLTALRTLKERYEFGGDVRQAESKWLQILREKLLNAANDLSDIGKYRLTQTVEWTIPEQSDSVSPSR